MTLVGEWNLVSGLVVVFVIVASPKTSFEIEFVGATGSEWVERNHGVISLGRRKLSGRYVSGRIRERARPRVPQTWSAWCC